MESGEVDGDRFGAVGEPVELLAVAPEGNVVVRGPRRRHVVLAGLAVAAVVGAAVAVVVLGGDDEPDPEAALRAAQELVEESGSYRFEQLNESSVSIGDPDGPGTDTTTRTLVSGTVAAPDTWHVVQDLGDMGFGLDELSNYETIRIGEELYSSGIPFASSGGPAWVAVGLPDDTSAEAVDVATMWEELGLDSDDPYVEEMLLAIVVQSYVSDTVGDPAAVTRVITELSDPVIEEQLSDGGTVLRARLAPDPTLAELGEAPPVDAVIDLDAEGRPEMVRFTATAGAASADVRITFADWGAALDVQAPPESDIDRTPWVAEEALAELDPSLLVAPTSVPAPLELVGATVFDESDFVEGFEEELGDVVEIPAPCPSLTLTYGSQEDLLAPVDADVDAFEDYVYLDLYVSDASCLPGGDFLPPFDGEFGGFPASGGDGYWDVEVGSATISVSSSLPDAELEPIVASIAPTTAAALVDAIPSWVADSPAMGGWFGLPMSPFGLGGLLGG